MSLSRIWLFPLLQRAPRHLYYSYVRLCMLFFSSGFNLTAARRWGGCRYHSRPDVGQSTAKASTQLDHNANWAWPMGMHNLDSSAEDLTIL